MFQETPGLMVCGACARSCTAVSLTVSPGVICAKYRCADAVAYAVADAVRRRVVIGSTYVPTAVS